MTIKIDLLPAYVGMRRWFKRALIFCVSLITVVGAVLFVFYYQGEQRLNKIKTDLANIKPVADQKRAAEASRDKANTEAAPYKATVDFIVDAGQSGPGRAALLDLIRRWIYEGALVKSIDISDGTVMKMNLALNKPDEYAQFLGILRKAGPNPLDPTRSGPLFKDLASASGIPGFGSGGAPAPPVTETAGLTFPLNITAQASLLNPVVVPVEPGAAAAAGAPGAGGPGGPGGGRPGGAGPA